MAGNTVYGMVVRAGMWSRVGAATKVVNETVTYAIVALSRRQSLNRTKHRPCS